MKPKKPVSKAAFALDEPNFNRRHYIPILKSKAGELWALGNVPAPDRAFVTPLLELHPEGQKPLAEHAAKVMAAMRIAWAGRAFFLDTCHFPGAGPTTAGIATTIFQAAAAEGLQFVPVTTLRRSAAHNTVVRAYAQRGAMIRLVPDDFSDLSTLAFRVNSLVSQLQLTRNKVDILIDFGSVANQMTQLAWIRAAVSVLPYLLEWRTLSVGGGSFPASIATQPANQWNSLPRFEWTAWVAAVTGNPPLPRVPAYADYGVRDTAPPANFGSPYANIRYTAGGLFLVRRNTVLVRDGGSTDIYPICASLRTRSEFSGANFSAGDERIEATALQQVSPGNAGSWTQWAMSHHFAFVVAEIRILLAA